MVKVPKQPPNWKKLLKERGKSIVDLSLDSKCHELFIKANRKYYYWDKFQCQPFPKGIDKAEAWSYIKWGRNQQMKKLPLNDINGEPFLYWIPEQLHECLHEIDLFFRANEVLESKQEMTKCQIHNLMEEAITSSQIEGAVTTLQQAKEMLKSQRKPKNHSEQMIYNNYLTMQEIKKQLDQPLSYEILFSLHKQVTNNTLNARDGEGRFRTVEENVTVVNHTGDVLFVPPDADSIPNRMEDFFTFANKKSSLHPIVKGIVLHFWLAYLHPFVDGNGRMARALFYWTVLKSGYELFEYISISKIIVQKTGQYGMAYLHTEYDENDVTYFLQFNLLAILEAIENLKIYMQKEQEITNTAIHEAALYPDINMRQSRLILHALNHPKELVTIKKHQNNEGLSYQTARTDLLQLVEIGFFQKIPKGKKFYFAPAENLSRKLQAKK